MPIPNRPVCKCEQVHVMQLPVYQAKRVVLGRRFVWHVVLRDRDEQVSSTYIGTHAALVAGWYESRLRGDFNRRDLLLVLETKEIWNVNFTLLMFDQTVMVLILLQSFLRLSLFFFVLTYNVFRTNFSVLRGIVTNRLQRFGLLWHPLENNPRWPVINVGEEWAIAFVVTDGASVDAKNFT